jgi:hypothetical protein
MHSVTLRALRRQSAPKSGRLDRIKSSRCRAHELKERFLGNFSPVVLRRRKSRLPDNQNRKGRMREHLGSLTSEHQPVDAAPTMRRHDDQIAILQLGGPNDRFCRGIIDFVQEFNGDAMLGRSFLDRREERSHLFVYLLIKPDGRIVNAAGNRGSRDLRRQRLGDGQDRYSGVKWPGERQPLFDAL